MPKAIAPRERLAYLISDFNDDSANIDMEWEKVSRHPAGEDEDQRASAREREGRR